MNRISKVALSVTCLFLSTSCALPSRLPPTQSPAITKLLTAQANEHVTPSPTPTLPLKGALGWGSIRGKITDMATGKPIAGVKVTCQHFSSALHARCNGSAFTDAGGAYFFPDLFFLDSDYIQIRIESPGYQAHAVYINVLENASPVIDIRLVPLFGTGTPQTMSCSLSGCVTFTPTITPAP